MPATGVENVNSNGSKPFVLIIDDQYRAFGSLPRAIESESFTPVWVPDEEEGLRLLKKDPQRRWIVIVDLKSSGMGGGGFLHRARRVSPRAAFLVTGPLGPFLYLNGNFYELWSPNLKQQINTVLNGISQRLGLKQEERAKGAGKPRNRDRFGAIIGRSTSINAIYELIQNIGDSDASVLIQGESGTGKELIARSIHQNSLRAKRPFVAINCGAIPASLIESELFGHERGAFTGAFQLKKGKFEVSQGGSLFLDEISELDRDLQVKLLRVIQEREFERVGGNLTLKADVRIIAATNQDLRSRVQTGDFREDLYYRLNVIPIHVAPLRERKEDIPLLLEHFIKQNAATLNHSPVSLGEDARVALHEYSYPGNVRELRNIVERLTVTCRRHSIIFEDLPDEVREEVVSLPGSRENLRDLPQDGVTLQEVERELILKTLEKTSGNKVTAARMLGITRRLLYLRLAQYGIA
jgi:DNA-binding NtrC family response regulator